MMEEKPAPNGWKWATFILLGILASLFIFVVGCCWGTSLGALLGRRTAQSERMGPMYFMPQTPDAPGIPLYGSGDAWLGVTFETRDEGARVLDVIPGSPAMQAGVRAGDIILKIDGRAVDQNHPLNERILEHAPGDNVTLTVQRGSAQLELPVRLGARSSQE